MEGGATPTPAHTHSSSSTGGRGDRRVTRAIHLLEVMDLAKHGHVLETLWYSTSMRMRGRRSLHVTKVSSLMRRP